MAKQLPSKVGLIGNMSFCSIRDGYGFVPKVDVTIDFTNPLCRAIHLNTYVYDNILVEFECKNCLSFVITLDLLVMIKRVVKF